MSGTIVEYLSEPRMATYDRSCNGDRARALDLYRSNATISGQAFTSLHYFEIILRNALDLQLRNWNQSKIGDSEWTLNAAPLLLNVLGYDRLKTARDDARKALNKRRQPTHDDVLAQFSLGTWRFLLPSQRHQGKQQLWDDALEGAFANRHGVRSDQIAQSTSIVYDLRNRVAHHEPIFELDLRGKRRAMRTVMQSIGGTARKWFVEHEPLSPGLDAFYAEWPHLERKN